MYNLRLYSETFKPYHCISDVLVFGLSQTPLSIVRPSSEPMTVGIIGVMDGIIESLSPRGREVFGGSHFPTQVTHLP